MGWRRSLDDRRREPTSIGPTTSRADAGGDSAHGSHLHLRSHFLVTEPFLVVGLIASIRRILVITLEAANLTKSGSYSAENAAIFRAGMIELGLLGLLVLVLVFSITLLRRFAPNPKNTQEL